MPQDDKLPTTAKTSNKPEFELTEVVDGRLTICIEKVLTPGTNKVITRPILLNKGTKVILAKDNFSKKDIPVAGQALLQKVYELGPEMVEHVMVKTRNGYKAPWEKAAEN